MKGLVAHSCGLYCPLRREGSSLEGREAARLPKCILVRAASGGVRYSTAVQVLSQIIYSVSVFYYFL